MDMATVTHNGKTFEVSSWPHPTRVANRKETYGSAQLIYDAPTYTSGSPEPKYVDERDLLGFEEAVLGWTRVNPTNPNRLNRNFPFSWPQMSDGSMVVSEVKLTNPGRGSSSPGGGQPTVGPTLVNRTPYDYWPGTPKNIYDATFGRVPWTRFLTDEQAYDGVSPPKELGRYVLIDSIYTPREFRRPDYGFVTDEATPKDALQVGFVPFIQAEVKYVWYQVPWPDCVPIATIQILLLRVNSTTFDASDYSNGWTAGTLLFTRTSSLYDYYIGPGDRKYIDIEFNFTWIPTGWNNYITPQVTSLGFPVTVPLKRKNVTPATPPYSSGDFNFLFDPGAP